MNAESWIRILQQHYPIDISSTGTTSTTPHKTKPSKQKGPHPHPSAWNVHKFGGSSFEQSDSYRFVASLIDKFEGKNLVVVSALSGVTNLLYGVCRRAREGTWEGSEEWVRLIERVSGTIKGRLGDSPSGFKETRRFAADLLYLAGVLSRMSSFNEEDQDSIEQMVVGYGEIWSARLMTQTMRDEYHRSVAFLDARNVLVVNQQGLDIEVQWDTTKRQLKKWFVQCRWCDVIIVTGFIARNLEGLPTTLKRNGSDFSATIFSVLTKANSVTIWKDVDGMFTADPKKNPNAVFVPAQTYEEAEEASRRGAFVIQADCIAPAKMFNIPIYLRNCFKLECPGTRIGCPIPPNANKTPDDYTTEEPVDHLLDSLKMSSDSIVSDSVETSSESNELEYMENHNEQHDAHALHMTTCQAEDQTLMEIIV